MIVEAVKYAMKLDMLGDVRLATLVRVQGIVCSDGSGGVKYGLLHMALSELTVGLSQILT